MCILNKRNLTFHHFHLAKRCFFQQGLNQCVLYFPNKGSFFQPEWDLAKKRGTQIQPTKLCQKSVEATLKKIEKDNPTKIVLTDSSIVLGVAVFSEPCDVFLCDFTCS